MTIKSVARLLASVAMIASCGGSDERAIVEGGPLDPLEAGMGDASAPQDVDFVLDGGPRGGGPDRLASEAGVRDAGIAWADTGPIPDPGEGASCFGLSDNCGPTPSEDCCKSLLVPGGSFYRSYDGTLAYPTQSYPATVSDFRLDKYEVTAARFSNFRRAWNAGWRPAAGDGKHSHLNDGNGLVNSAEQGFESGWDVVWTQNVSASTGFLGREDTEPVGGINWFEAYGFCIWDGGFLPSEAEWNYAAVAGAEQRVYPWSVPPASTTFNESHAVFCYTGTVLPGPTCANPLPVGSRPAGYGKWGHADFIGNEEEWNLDAFVSPYEVACNDCSHLPSNESVPRVTRGGAFVDSGGSRLSPSFRWSADSTARVPGVRCARSP